MLYQTHASSKVLRVRRTAPAPHEIFERSAQVKSLDYAKLEAGLTIRAADQAIAAAAARKRCGSWESGAADNYTDWLALSTRELRE